MHNVKKIWSFFKSLTVHQTMDDEYLMAELNFKSAMIDWSSDLYTQEVCCVLPIAMPFFRQFRWCKRRKHQTKLVLACSYRKQGVKKLYSSPWGQHHIHPICLWVCASTINHKTQSRGEVGESILVKKTTMENIMTSEVVWPLWSSVFWRPRYSYTWFLWDLSAVAGSKSFFIYKIMIFQFIEVWHYCKEVEQGQPEVFLFKLTVQSHSGYWLSQGWQDFYF